MDETAAQVKEKKTDYTNDSQQNLMRIAEYLAADVFKPTTIKDIAAKQQVGIGDIESAMILELSQESAGCGYEGGKRADQGDKYNEVA
ncbi:MAG: hypothetical protein HZB80_11385 [Deltaproteobacteria bacterium]|nr:hypothetical protein [Deltaproteobacteria bacterium]